MGHVLCRDELGVWLQMLSHTLLPRVRCQMDPRSKLLTFEGCNYFRQRLVLSTLSSRPVRIARVREDADEPGLREFEAGFIRLLDKLTNGSRIEVNETGTSVFYHPGLLAGGKLEHDCSCQRSIGYFLEPLMMLAPFAKSSVCVTLRGLTSGPEDPSVDYYRMCVLPLLKKLLPVGEVELKIHRRGVGRDGCGEVVFSCPVVRKMRPVQMTEEGKVRRVRGVAYTVRANPSMANRMVDSARSVLNKFLPDVYIYTDIVRGAEAGKSPGYGLTLVSESTEGMMHAADGSSHSKQFSVSTSGVVPPTPMLPEDIGRQTALLLIEEIVRGGCTDSGCQVIALLFMALGQKDVSKIQLGELTPYTVQFLRHLRDFFQVTYKVDCREELLDSVTRQVITLSCVGVGFSNFSRGIL